MSSKTPRSLGERRRQLAPGDTPVVRPKWPMLALMFAGVWLAWPWALLNEVLMKSDDVRRQARIVVIGLLGAFVLAALVMALVELELLGVREARYAVIFMFAWKLGISYMLELRQQKTFDLWEYFGGSPMNGAYVLITGALLSDVIFEQLPFGVLWLVLR